MPKGKICQMGLIVHWTLKKKRWQVNNSGIKERKKKNPRVSGNATRAYMEMKEPEIAKTILKRKSEVGKFTLPDVKIYDKAIIRPYKDRQVY